MKSKLKTIIFDLDGTLYELEGGSFRSSPLSQKVRDNAQKYIADKLSKTPAEAQVILEDIISRYREDISIGLEKEFDLDRYDYFQTVWNISAKGIVKPNGRLRGVLERLNSNYRLVLVSDAPQVWINNVLQELDVKDLFDNYIFSGEGNSRKGFNNAFSQVLASLEIMPGECWTVGDQETTDIIPAKGLGLKTIFIHPDIISSQSDLNLKTIEELPAALSKFV